MRSIFRICDYNEAALIKYTLTGLLRIILYTTSAYSSPYSSYYNKHDLKSKSKFLWKQLKYLRTIKIVHYEQL